MSKKIKLSLSIQVNEIDGDVEFDVDPYCQPRIIDDVWMYEWWHEPKKKFRIRVTLKNKKGTQSHLNIKEVRCNDVVLNNIDRWGKYIMPNGAIRSTYGYMDLPGCYMLSVHQNALVHNYMSYFLDRSKQHC